MVLHKIAWRNLWRNRRRTILTLSAIGFSASILVFFIGLQLSSYEASINATCSIFQGHLQVQRFGYLDTPEMRKWIPDVGGLEQRIASIPGVKAAGARGFGFAVASSEDRSYGVQVVGVEPEQERRISTIPGLIKAGRYLDGINADQVVVGQALAHNLKLKLGSELTLIGQAEDGSVAATVLQVVGLFESGIAELDRNMIEMPLGTFQTNFSMESRAHVVAVAVDNIKSLDQIRNEVAQIVKGAEKNLVVLGWEELNPGLKQSIQFDMSFGWLFYISLVLIVTFSVLNTFLMCVLERTREFGLLLALGMTPGQIISLVLLESIFMLVGGVVVGICIGAATIAYYHKHGFSIPGSEEIMKLWHITTAVHPEISFAALTTGPATLLIAGFLSALIPVLRIRKLTPVEAMRAI